MTMISYTTNPSRHYRFGSNCENIRATNLEEICVISNQFVLKVNQQTADNKQLLNSTQLVDLTLTACCGVNTE